MPAEDVGPERNAGVWEIRVAPGNASRLYMSYRGLVYRSNDRGAHWTRTTFARVETDANDDYRTFGQKMAVTPATPTSSTRDAANGLFASFDGGGSWQAVAAVPVASKAGVTGIVFDPSSGATGGRTRTAYASSYGNGVWRTGDAGATWARVGGGPRTVDHAVVAADGLSLRDLERRLAEHRVASLPGRLAGRHAARSDRTGTRWSSTRRVRRASWRRRTADT